MGEFLWDENEGISYVAVNCFKLRKDIEVLVKDTNMSLRNLFADSFNCPLKYTGRTNYNYFDAHKGIDYHELQC